MAAPCTQAAAGPRRRQTRAQAIERRDYILHFRVMAGRLRIIGRNADQQHGAFSKFTDRLREGLHLIGHPFFIVPRGCQPTVVAHDGHLVAEQGDVLFIGA